MTEQELDKLMNDSTIRYSDVIDDFFKYFREHCLMEGESFDEKGTEEIKPLLYLFINWYNNIRCM